MILPCLWKIGDGDSSKKCSEFYEMRGNWEETEPLAHTPNHHLKQQIQNLQTQQQQTILLDEQKHPILSATTPVWDIADRIIKEEPLEDKNCDSGISPGHDSNSNSPRSDRSSTTANCSLSPGSAVSQDSTSPMQCGDYDYCSQGPMFKDCLSPVDYTRMDDSQITQSLDLQKNMKDMEEMETDTLQCPICAFTSMDRLSFTEHLAKHYAANHSECPELVKTILDQVANSNGSMTRESSNERSSPLMSQEQDRSEHESEEAEEPGLRVPRVNSQGKVKTFRCKQCSFVAITKLEFWDHSRGHIKAEKLLTCPKCPFVTEYKHHLEYHLRNHIGSKPFKCDKCSYSCVNKSMLNSHLKSHSSVYQYRCSDCSYATKYCHSLKLHLRKYSHRPAMVLNADGSPNPLPIIDVYGTRRGPKQKVAKSQEDSQNITVSHNDKSNNNNNNNNNNTNNNNTNINNSANSNNSNNHNISNNNFNGGSHNNSIVSVDSQVSPMIHSHLVNSVSNDSVADKSEQNLLPFFNPIFNGFSLNHLKMDIEKDKPSMMDFCSTEKSPENLSTETQNNVVTTTNVTSPKPKINSKPFNIHSFTNAAAILMSENQCLNHNDTRSASIPPPSEEIVMETSSVTDSLTRPLDLTKPKENHKIMSKVLQKATGTSRRKGKAIKLERRQLVEEETDEDEVFHEYRRLPRIDIPKSKLTCDYCEITYDNAIMYAVHMGFHVNNDPYTCSICGHKCTDNLSFYLHLFKGNHF